MLQIIELTGHTPRVLRLAWVSHPNWHAHNHDIIWHSMRQSHVLAEPWWIQLGSLGCWDHKTLRFWKVFGNSETIAHEIVAGIELSVFVWDYCLEFLDFSCLLCRPYIHVQSGVSNPAWNPACVQLILFMLASYCVASCSFYVSWLFRGQCSLQWHRMIFRNSTDNLVREHLNLLRV